MNVRRTARSEGGVIAFLAFIGVLMAFGIDAALPAFDELRTAFELDGRGLSPAITGTFYFVGMAIGQLVAGIGSDRFGRRPVLMTGIAVYALGALVSTLAGSLGVLLVGRFVWGLGAAAPTVIRFAIARDLFAGDRMARVVSTFSAVFLLGPIFVPFVGEAILVVGDWRTVFASSLVLAVVAAVWAIGFGETLPASQRRPLRFAPLLEALRATASTPVTRWLLVAQAFFGGAFFIWLGSAQPVIGEIYGRDGQFTLFFGCSGIGMAAALLLNRRLIDRFGSALMVRRAAAVFVVVSTIGLVVALAAGGRPSIWLWFAWAMVANAMSMIMGPMSAALALEPMADKAGTVSALLGVAQLGLGAGLAALVDARIDDTVTPMLLGALLYGAVGWSCVQLALRARVGDQPISSGISLLRRAT